MFDVVHRYDVYASLEAQAAYLKLNANGIYLLELQAAFADLQVSLNTDAVAQHLGVPSTCCDKFATHAISAEGIQLSSAIQCSC